MGMDWWVNNPAFMREVREPAQLLGNRDLEERLARLEASLLEARMS